MKPLSVMIWGGVSAVGRTPLIFIPDGVKINAETYKDFILEPVVKDLSQTMFPDSHLFSNKMELLLIRRLPHRTG